MTIKCIVDVTNTLIYAAHSTVGFEVSAVEEGIPDLTQIRHSLPCEGGFLINKLLVIPALVTFNRYYVCYFLLLYEIAKCQTAKLWVVKQLIRYN